MCKEITMTKEERRIYEWCMKNEKDNAVAVYGGVYHSIEKIMNGDMKELLLVIYHAINNNKFFKVEESNETVFKTICRLCYVDSMLVKIYAQAIGVDIL